jgi:hypothetical protein
MKELIRVAFIAAAIALIAATASAQSDPLDSGRGIAWGSIGFQGDLGGSLNTSGIGVVGGQRAEIDTNTWSERYDAALIFRIGGAYNLTGQSQVFGAMTWEQSEADTTDVGLVGGQPLQAKFSDYQGWGIDAGYRYFFRTQGTLKPFVGASLGFQRVQDITVNFSSPTFNANDVPFYDDSWVAGWRLSTGFLRDINERVGWQVTLDLKYAGVLSDQSGIGTLGFERVNNKGNRFTLPIMVGAYYKF